MQAELVFNIFNTLILPPWLLMIIAPRWWVTQKLVNSYIIPLALAVAYVIIIFSNLQGIASADFGSLKGIQNLFVAAGSAPFFAAAAWFHYLAFDLLVGTWILNDSQKTGITHWLIIPCLFFTFMLGPTGFLLYHLIKWAYSQMVNKM
jgi:hypothetical protein